MENQLFNVNESPKTFAYVIEHLVPKVRCNRCGSPVLKSELEEYTYQCMFCDEDLFTIETHTGDVMTTKELDEICCQTRDLLLLDEKSRYNSRKFILVPEYEDCTIFAIEPSSTGKVIHYYGYGYEVEDKNDNNNENYRFLEYTFFTAPLSEAIKSGISTYERNNQEHFKQSISDCSEELMKAIYQHYNNGKHPKFIEEENITEDTPYGMYILLKTDDMKERTVKSNTTTSNSELSFRQNEKDKIDGLTYLEVIENAIADLEKAKSMIDTDNFDEFEINDIDLSIERLTELSTIFKEENI